MRSYRLEVDTDLLGAWLVDVMLGRIGARRRHIRNAMENKDEARKPVRRSWRENPAFAEALSGE
jgi:hypothetical protein